MQEAGLAELVVLQGQGSEPLPRGPPNISPTLGGGAQLLLSFVPLALIPAFWASVSLFVSWVSQTCLFIVILVSPKQTRLPKPRRESQHINQGY